MPIYHGHAPGHVRDTFCNAVEAFHKWRAYGGPQPMVEFAFNHEPRAISLSDACGLVWNCTDTLPGEYVAVVTDLGFKRRDLCRCGASDAEAPRGVSSAHARSPGRKPAPVILLHRAGCCFGSSSARKASRWSHGKQFRARSAKAEQTGATLNERYAIDMFSAANQVKPAQSSSLAPPKERS
jgi:hypothetical protein